MIQSTLVPAIYLLSAILFIVGLKRLSNVRKSRSGNQTAAVAMLLAVVGSLLELGSFNPLFVVIGLAVGSAIGAFIALRVPMTSMPEMVALLNGTGGASSGLVAVATFFAVAVEGGQELDAVTGGVVGVSLLIAGITLTGSLVAWGKLQGKIANGNPVILPARHALNLLMLGGVVVLAVLFTMSGGVSELSVPFVVGIAVLSLVLGVTLVLPIGGADMPVVVSLLNSYSGLAAAAAGFVVQNNLLIIGGAMVGAAGLILTQIMCVAMNRSLLNVLVGGFGEESSGSNEDARNYDNITSTGAAEAAMMLDLAESVCVVPGYGLAVAQAQHAMRELEKALEERGVTVTYAIHPVAGRMPGHMNVLLAEADVSYDKLLELEPSNAQITNADVCIVVGANDVVNPAAVDEADSPIYGMPVIHAWAARQVYVIKRSLSPGYAGIKNPLFERPNTTMLFGDAKQMLQDMATEYQEL